MDSHSTMRAAATCDARCEIEDTDRRSASSAFAALYAAHYDFLWRCALRMGTPAADVDDLVQECFVVALRRFDRFDPQAGARASTWLFAILRNVQRNHARSLRRRAARLELISRSASEQAPNGADAALAGRLLDDFLTTLDEDKRAAFVLAEIEGLTGPEIAERTGLTAGSVRVNLHRGMALLRAALLQGNEAIEP